MKLEPTAASSCEQPSELHASGLCAGLRLRGEQQRGVSAAVRVSAIHVRALLEALEAVGKPLDEFVRYAGLAPSVLVDRAACVSLDELDRLTCLAVDWTGDPAFGLHWGERSPMIRFDVLALLFMQAPTPRAGLAALLRCQRILGDHHEVLCEENARRVRLCVRPLARSPVAARARTELAFSGFLRLLVSAGADRQLGGVRIQFQYERPAYAAEYERVFGTGCRYLRPVSALEFDRVWLDQPLRCANEELFQLMVAYAERELDRVDEARSLAEQVRRELRASLPTVLKMNRVARSLRTSVRTLRRRLADEGVTYSEVLQQAQCELAERLLRDKDRSIQQVSCEVGFTSVSAFCRAFKRWTGTRPTTLREPGRAA